MEKAKKLPLSRRDALLAGTALVLSHAACSPEPLTPTAAPSRGGPIMNATLPPTAVVRISRSTFDPARYAEVEQMSRRTAEYLIPAIRGLPGLIRYYAVLSPTGSYAHVSVWDSEAHADQMSHLKEMIIDARRDAEQVGAQFTPIVNHSISWSI